MAIIDLKSRLTTKWSEFSKYQSSSDSFIYISDTISEDTIWPTSIDLIVGDTYFNLRSNVENLIPDEGLVVHPKESVIIYSKRKFQIPNNVFGMVAGKSNLNFQGAFIATGKISPGFDGHLKIGVYNGGWEKILLQKGTKFASAFFMTIESESSDSTMPYQQAPSPKEKKKTFKEKATIWFNNNWQTILPILLSIIAIIVSIFKPS